MRKAHVYYQDKKAGVLQETKQGFEFIYDENYLKTPGIRPISVGLPLQKEVYAANVLFAFFDGLIPEGWFLEIASRKLKVDAADRFGFLLATSSHTIGAVSVQEVQGVEDE